MATYSMIGNVRGHCGHNHTTIRGAARCSLADSRYCKLQGGYSDRSLHVNNHGGIDQTPDEDTHADFCDQIDRLRAGQ